MASYDGGGFDGWLRDSLFGDVPEEKVERVKKLLEPYREGIQYALDHDYDPEEHSWRDYRNSLWYRVDDEVNKAIDVILETPRTRFERI